MCVLGHQESDFQSSFMPLGVMNGLKIITDKRRNQLSESVVWPLRHSQKWQFSLSGRGEWY